MGDGLCVLVSLGVGDRQHVERVIVVRIFVPHQPQVRNRLIVLAAVAWSSPYAPPENALKAGR